MKHNIEASENSAEEAMGDKVLLKHFLKRMMMER